MISIIGLTLKDENNEKVDISIVETGLRPGEKLYAELFINGKSKKTINPINCLIPVKRLGLIELQTALTFHTQEVTHLMQFPRSMA